MPGRSQMSRLRTALFSGIPDLALRLSSTAFEDRLTALLGEQEFDVAQIEGLEMARLWSAAWERANFKRRPRLILDEHNAEYVLQRRAFEIDLAVPSRWVAALYSLQQWFKLRHYERHICKQMDGILTVSETDRQQLLKLRPGKPVEVVANGVDVTYFDEVDVSGTPLGEASVVFTGTMDFRPNVDAVTWFAYAIWPRVIQAVPTARFYIVGRNPKSEVLNLEHESGIVATGAVRDVRPYLKGAVLGVVPLRMGGGSRLKILESMAASLPVVSTSLGAEGIDITPGENIAIADDPEEFARTIVALIGDSQRRAALAANGRRLVAARYDWPGIVPELDAIYGRLCPGQTAAAT
jgi:polysaccharide biosynthesis protein PslH